MVGVVHVPAWKKLGLKLKYAKDLPTEGHEGFSSENVRASVVEDGDAGIALESLGLTLKKVKKAKGATPEDGQSTVIMPNKRKRELSKDDQDLVSSPRKKHRKSQAAALKSNSGGVIESPAALRQTPAASNINSAPSPTKRKSVSFTPETKTKDGDSIKQLYNAWLAEQTDDFNPQTSAKALRPVSSSPAGAAEKPSKVKKARKLRASKSTLLPPSVVLQGADQSATADTKELPKSKKVQHREVPGPTLSPPSAEPSAATQSCEPAYIPPYLQYLNEYHTSRSTWKFNKAKQTTLLKHVFDPAIIPPTYDLALQTYLTGLNGLAARARLRETALDVLKSKSQTSKPDSKMNDEERRAEDARIAEIFKFDPVEHLRQKRQREEEYVAAGMFHVKKLKGIQACREEYEKEQDPAWQLTLAKRQRADLVLAAIPSTLGNANIPVALDDDEDDAADAGGRRKKRSRVPSHMRRARQRKRRTGVPDDDSSSGETTSSDDDAPGAAGPSSSAAAPGNAGEDAASSSLSSATASVSEDSSDDDAGAGNCPGKGKGRAGEGEVGGGEEGVEPAAVGEDVEGEGAEGDGEGAGEAAAEAAPVSETPTPSPEKDHSSDGDYVEPASRSKKGKAVKR